MTSFALEILPDTLAICRLDSNAATPDWAKGAIVSVTRTPEELSVVCSQQSVPENIQTESGWRCLRVAGPLEFSLVGVIASLTTTLAAANISVFVISTFDTDYLMVKDSDLEEAIASFRSAGHSVSS